jgi:hypothetical protein
MCFSIRFTNSFRLSGRKPLVGICTTSP